MFVFLWLFIRVSLIKCLFAHTMQQISSTTKSQQMVQLVLPLQNSAETNHTDYIPEIVQWEATFLKVQAELANQKVDRIKLS